MSTPTGGDADIAAVGALLGDASRAAIVQALTDGRSLPASRLAVEAGVSASTASSHLGKLASAGLLAVETHGRHRYYRLAGPPVAQLVETLQQFAPRRPVTSLREGTRAEALRAARTCYDHLAGRLGVGLMQGMLERRLIVGGSGDYDAVAAERDRPAAPGHDLDYELTESGREFVIDFGVRLPPRRRLIRYCVDWTEQRHHLAGALGRGLLDRLLEQEWIRRVEGHRAVRLTDLGRHELPRIFGLQLD